MTMELIERILKENNIPKSVHFMSDSGWECGPTEMDGVFYNRQTNTIVFTQGIGREYETDEWEMLYRSDLIRVGEIEVYPASNSISLYGLTEEYKKALREAGDFEEYYGIAETEDKYDEIDLACRPLFYCIMLRWDYIGYIGFHEEGSDLEPEIYIFKQYRNNGYGTRVLKRFVDIAFNEGLLKTWREENPDNSPPRFITKEEQVFPARLVSTVRVENEYSRKMMKACGFRENKEAVAEILIFEDDEASETGFVQVSEFSITKEEYMKRGVKNE